MAKRKEQFRKQQIATMGHSDKASRGWDRFYKKVAHVERMVLEGKSISTLVYRGKLPEEVEEGE